VNLSFKDARFSLISFALATASSKFCLATFNSLHVKEH
jgi:hypothetical protein